jgi:hypothetical protein
MSKNKKKLIEVTPEAKTALDAHHRKTGRTRKHIGSAAIVQYCRVKKEGLK